MHWSFLIALADVIATYDHLYKFSGQKVLEMFFFCAL